MEKFTKKFKDFMYESLEDKFKDKLSDDNQSIKRGILLLLDDSIENSDNLVNVQNFINKYLENDKSVTLVGLINDGEIFDFWNKYKEEIDNICKTNNYFEKTPSENNVFSVYDFMINATKFSVKKIMKNLETELFSK